MKRFISVLGVVVPIAKWLASEQNRMKVRNILGKLNITPSIGKK